MTQVAAWNSLIYQQTVLTVLSFLFVAGIFTYVFRKKNHYFVISWASIKSWLFVAPLLFLCMGAPEPWPLVVLTCLAILGAKVFFQLMGMFHRSYFVFACYAAIMCLGGLIYFDRIDLYNLMPMLLLGFCCLIPLFRNNYRRMIQYIALTQLAFVFLGWSFMHLGLVLKLENGIYQVMYLIILTEFCDNTVLATSRYFGRSTLFDRISRKRSVGGFLFSFILTLLLAFAMRHLLPDRSEKYWLASGIIASLGGAIGDLVMTVVRRDAGIKIVGLFILGRGDFLNRMDRLIFVAPIYYYVMFFVLKMST